MKALQYLVFLLALVANAAGAAPLQDNIKIDAMIVRIFALLSDGV